MVNTRRRLGLTLVEVLVATAILGVTLGFVALTQASNLRITRDSRAASDATEFANRALESEFRRVIADFATTQANCPAAAACPTTLADGRFQGQMRVSTAGTGYLEAGLVRITVTMTEPADVAFTRLVSCMDVSPAPAVAIPAPCPAPVAP